MRYYQTLVPLKQGQHVVGTIAILQSQKMLEQNTAKMLRTLSLIALATLILVLPIVWYFANALAQPIVLISHIFHNIAKHEQYEQNFNQLANLYKIRTRNDEIGELTQSFMLMRDVVVQKIQQINVLNASLEQKVHQRTEELRLANQELAYLAEHDVLTGLPNRKLLSDRLHQAMMIAKRDGMHTALVFIDLDEFKPINDQYGHDVGDWLLKETANRIQLCLREADTVSRIGGDEFIVLLPEITSERDALRVAEKIREALFQPFEHNGMLMHVSASMGLALYPEHGHDECALFKHADTAMYCAKNEGRNRIKIFDAAVSA